MLVLQKQIQDSNWPSCPWVFSRYGKRIKNFYNAWGEATRRAGLWMTSGITPTDFSMICGERA